MAAVFSTSNSIFFQTIYPLEQKLRQNGEPELLKSFHSDIKDGHALNSHLEILQTSSSKPYVLLGKALMVGISQLSKMLKSLLSDTNDGHALNSLHGILQTTSSKFNALLRLGIAKIFYLDIKDGHELNSRWNSSSNCFFKTICPLEQKPGKHGGSD